MIPGTLAANLDTKVTLKTGFIRMMEEVFLIITTLLYQLWVTF